MLKRLFLIDGSSYIYRAYHAITPLSTSKGFPTHAIYGVTNMLLKIMREKEPDYIAVVFDAKGPTFRHKESPTYKANRPPMPDDLTQQIPYIKKIIKAFGIPSLEKEGYEADDLMATLCQRFSNKNIEIILVSGDKDLRQLLSDKVRLWDSMQDKVLEKRDILAQYKLPPARLKEIMAITGDKIDNIPGVPGVGEKTAIKLLQDFGSLENLLNNLDKVKPQRLRENLKSHKEQILKNLKLVSLDASVPLEVKLEDLRPGPKDFETLKKLFEELEFRKFLKELYQPLSKVNYNYILKKEDLEELVEKLKKAKEIIFNLKTTNKSIVGFSFSYQLGEAWYIPVGHFYLLVPKQLSLEYVLEKIKPVLENEKILKIGQDIKYSILVLRQHGIKLKGISFDTMIAAYVLNPGQSNYNLEELAQIYLKIRKKDFKEIIREGRKEIPFSQVKIDVASDYACEEADVILRLKPILEKKLKESNQEELFKQIEMPLLSVLADMEWWGVKIDVTYLNHLSRIFTDKLRNIERHIFELAGEEFNINSPTQLRHILFEKLKLPRIKKTRGKTAYSTDAEVLSELAFIHPLPKEILNYRTIMKLKSSYVDALPHLIDPKTGRIHTSYNQAVTVTGRLSSSEPNLQNIPTRGEEGKSIRKAFIPESGWFYLAADYSQIELRILAHLSEDKALLDAFYHDKDIHTHTAVEIFKVAPEAVTEDMRRQAKVINFGIIYGMSPYGLSRELGIDVGLAKVYIEEYFKRYSGVQRYIEHTLEQTRKKGYVETLFKRKRFIPEINSRNSTMRKAGERIAINTPIQGTAAEIIKLAMIKIWRLIKEKKLKTKMIMQVHDELIFEIPPEEVEQFSSLLKETMEGVVNLKVPLKVNIKIGKNWADVS
ncbi:MAG: DNA polymerase I [Candidatus Desulfofervidus auxilii]|nr:DNA polymerase I [Candidatus Desulfofervidus auxilii]